MRLFPRGVPVSKRLFDLLVSLVGLILALPVMLFIALLLLFVQGWPVFFCQPRPGYCGQIFNLCKFRSMRAAVDRHGNPLPDGQRLTRIGKFLRATSLDELPEILNVIKGEMSLVGPRPLLVEYLERYSPEQARRHDVLPGITGWAQVNGRNILSWEDKFRLDVWYVDHWSFGLDLKILGMTVGLVLRREGISQPGQATTQYFMGNENPADKDDRS
jgi:lipopolysaccharide/colanic/teichoic acid biosynthesis glycosyltransferase